MGRKHAVHRPSDLLTARIASLAVKLWLRDEAAVDELRLLASEFRRDGDVVTAVGPSGILCGFVLGHDPVTQAAQVALFTLGVLWPRVCPALLGEADRMWKDEVERSRARPTPEQRVPQQDDAATVEAPTTKPEQRPLATSERVLAEEEQ